MNRVEIAKGYWTAASFVIPYLVIPAEAEHLTVGTGGVDLSKKKLSKRFDVVLAKARTQV